MLTKLALTWALLMTGQASGETFYTSLRSGRIPAGINNPERRDEIKEMHLYESADRGRSWVLRDKIGKESDGFSYQVPKDGEYWYHVVLINQQGKQEPADIYKAPPLMKLIVDTRRPDLKITSAQRQGDELVVQWLAVEDNPDPAALKVEYRTADSQSWVNMPLTPSPTGTTRAKVPATALVGRLSLTDMAKNSYSVETQIPAGPPGAAGVAAAGYNPPPADIQKTAAINTVHPALDPQPLIAPPPPPPGYPGVTEQQPIVTPPGAQHQGGPAIGKGQVVASSSDNNQGSLLPQPAPAATVPQRNQPQLQIVNDPEIVIEYEVSKVGPSGLGVIQVWITRDGGVHWEPYMEDDKASLVTQGGKYQRTLLLPGEGVFGISLVVKSKVGMGRPAPRPGDAPEMQVEVDTTAPVATLFKPLPDPMRRDCLVLTWTATDRNLGASPITLEWAEQPAGPWQPIAADLPNTGSYSWKLPARMPSHAHLKMTVRDTAGNAAAAITAEPQLIDLSVPEGRLIGVRVTPKKQ